MDDLAVVETSPEETAQIQRAMNEMFEKMEQADGRIHQNQQEINRLKIETQAILKELKVTA